MFVEFKDVLEPWFRETLTTHVVDGWSPSEDAYSVVFVGYT